MGTNYDKKNLQTYYPPVSPFYSLVAPSEEKTTLHQLEVPTSPRIFTSEEHNKTSWMVRILLEALFHESFLRNNI
jgi:hypothetical protein